MKSTRPRQRSPARQALKLTAQASTDPIAGLLGGVATLFGNSSPIQHPIQTGQSAAGVVSGELNAADPDGTALTFSVTQAPARGSVVVDADGSYSYTPDPAVAAAGTTDSFQVSVSDASSGFHIHGLPGLINLLTLGLIGADGHTSTAIVPVTVAPFAPGNTAPSGSATVGSPDPLTGMVNGTVVGTDADGDSLTYSGPGATTKGTVSINASSGAFSYIPTSVARTNAGAPGATTADRQDTFSVTIADGHGGTTAVAVTVPIGAASTPSSPLPAFDGAEGFGAYATGGRGGSVIYVTNLDADGVGSLQWAIDQPGPKYILFKVSGLIDSQIHLTNGDATIAGQTSPGGITIRGFVTDETPYQDQDVHAPADFAENWILQHVRIRPGLTGPSDDGLRLRYTRNAIVDHVSIGNADRRGGGDLLLARHHHSNTIIAETVGGHSFYGGVLMNYSNPANGFALDNVSLHHNVFNRIEGRLPEGSRESLAAAGSFMNLELSDNLYWDPRFFIALGPNTGVVTNGSGNPYPIYWKINAVNNYFQTGPAFPYGMFDDQIMRTALNELYVSGNQMSLYPTRSDYELFYCCNDYSRSPIRTRRPTLRRNFRPGTRSRRSPTRPPTCLPRSCSTPPAPGRAIPWTCGCSSPSPPAPSPARHPTPTLPAMRSSRHIPAPLHRRRWTPTLTACPTIGRSPRDSIPTSPTTTRLISRHRATPTWRSTSRSFPLVALPGGRSDRSRRRPAHAHRPSRRVCTHRTAPSHPHGRWN